MFWVPCLLVMVIVPPRYGDHVDYTYTVHPRATHHMLSGNSGEEIIAASGNRFMDNRLYQCNLFLLVVFLFGFDLAKIANYQ